MKVTLVGIVILVNALQPLKVFSWIVVIPYGIIILVNALQLPKALLPMEVTLLGIFTLVNALQLPKALKSIKVTLLGIVILVNTEQKLKALVPMEVTVLGIFSTWVKLVLQVWPLNPVKLIGLSVVVYCVFPLPVTAVQVHPDNGFVIVAAELKTKVRWFTIYIFSTLK